MMLWDYIDMDKPIKLATLIQEALRATATYDQIGTDFMSFSEGVDISKLIVSKNLHLSQFRSKNVYLYYKKDHAYEEPPFEIEFEPRNASMHTSEFNIPDESDLHTYYFTYGTEGFPFVGGWTKITAPSVTLACTLFKQLHPNKIDGVLNCSDVYTEEDFMETEMYMTDNFGHRAHEAYAISVTQII